ncbi:MAG: hypothetical protein IJA82_01910 [Clostridia bacterium]|nr:hypothetical protein [Clostridia bacterium]
MTPKEQFINAIDILNKKAYDLVNQNAKGWARIAYRDGLITHEECTGIENCVNIRNAMVHGWMEEISITEYRVKQVNGYIDLMVYGKRQAPNLEEEEIIPTPQPKPQPQPQIQPKQEEMPTLSDKDPDMTITGISSRNVKIKLNNGQCEFDLKNVKSTCCDWGDEKNWPSLEIMLKTNKIIKITYNRESVDMDGESPYDYCDGYGYYYQEDGADYYDFLKASRKMLQNDIRRIFDKCDKTSIFLDGLIVNTVNMTEIKSIKECISIRLYDDTLLETGYTECSIDHKGRDIDYYVDESALTINFGNKAEVEYSFAINEMTKADFEYAEAVYLKTRAKRR